MEVEKVVNDHHHQHQSRKPLVQNQPKKLKTSHHQSKQHQSINSYDDDDDEPDQDEEQMSTASSSVSNLKVKNGTTSKSSLTTVKAERKGPTKVSVSKKKSSTEKQHLSESSASSRSSSAYSDRSSSSGSSSSSSSGDSESENSSDDDEDASSNSSQSDMSDLLSLTSDDESNSSLTNSEDNTNDSEVSATVGRKLDVEEGEIIEGSGGGGVVTASQANKQPSQSTPVSIAVAAQYAQIKAQIKQVRHKCNAYGKKLKKLTKELKAKRDKTGKKTSSKHLKLKKRLHSKYLSYKTRLTGLLSRQASLISKEPGLAATKKSDRKSKKISSRKSRKHKNGGCNGPRRRHRASKSEKGRQRRKVSKNSQGKRAREKRENSCVSRSPPSASQTANEHVNKPSTPVAKLPYPVLNDKREMSLIKNILREKQRGLTEMYEKTLASLNASDESEAGEDNDDGEQKRTRLRNLHENIKLQLTRLNRQIDYVKVNLEVDELSRIVAGMEANPAADYAEIARLNKRLVDLNNQREDLLVEMQDANRRFLKQHEQQQQRTRNGQHHGGGHHSREEEDGDDKNGNIRRQPNLHNYPPPPPLPTNAHLQSPGQLNDYFRNVPPPNSQGITAAAIQSPIVSPATISSKFQPYKGAPVPVPSISPNPMSYVNKPPPQSLPPMMQAPMHLGQQFNHQFGQKQNMKNSNNINNNRLLSNNTHPMINQARARTPPPPANMNSNRQPINGVRTPPYPSQPLVSSNVVAQQQQDNTPPFGRLFATAAAAAIQANATNTANVGKQQAMTGNQQRNQANNNNNNNNSKNTIRNKSPPQNQQALNNNNNINNNIQQQQNKFNGNQPMPTQPVQSQFQNSQFSSAISSGIPPQMQAKFQEIMQRPHVKQAIRGMFETMSPAEKKNAMDTGFSNFNFNSIIQMLQSKGLINTNEFKSTFGLSSATSSSSSSSSSSPSNFNNTNQTSQSNFSNISMGKPPFNYNDEPLLPNPNPAAMAAQKNLNNINNVNSFSNQNNNNNFQDTNLKHLKALASSISNGPGPGMNCNNNMGNNYKPPFFNPTMNSNAPMNKLSPNMGIAGPSPNFNNNFNNNMLNNQQFQINNNNNFNNQGFRYNGGNVNNINSNVQSMNNNFNNNNFKRKHY